MRTIIAGSRSITSYSVVNDAISESGFEITRVVCGMARGVDKLGQRWALIRKIPVDRFPAEWDKYGRSAGPIRNEEMAKHADALIAVWDGKSKGTLNMINIAKKMNLKVFIYNE